MLAAFLFVLVTSALQAASPEGADDPVAPLVGQRIRVTENERGDRGSPRSFSGTLAEYDGKQLVVTNGKARRTLPLDHVLRVEVSGGKRSMKWKGAKIGAVVGALSGLAFSLSCEPQCFHGNQSLAPREAFALSAVLAASGGVAGFAIGAPFKGERWVSVKLKEHRRVTIRLSTVRQGMAVNVAVPFGTKREFGKR